MILGWAQTLDVVLADSGCDFGKVLAQDVILDFNDLILDVISGSDVILDNPCQNHILVPISHPPKSHFHFCREITSRPFTVYTAVPQTSEMPCRGMFATAALHLELL